MLNYKKAQSAEQPNELDTISSQTTVYLRKNIVEKTTTDENGDKSTYYEYDECKLTKTEYRAYLLEKQRADIDYIALMSGVDLDVWENQVLLWKRVMEQGESD